MRSLPKPQVNALEIYDRISKAKQPPRRQRLKDARRVVAAAYHQYSQVAPEFTRLSAVQLADVEKAALHHAFEVDTQPMIELREALNSPIATVTCPFCSIGEPSALDHYLPKERYAQYAVYPLNLIPACAKCNSHKRTLVLIKGTSVRCFLHPYIDAVPAVPFLSVQVDVVPDAIDLRYRVEPVHGLTARQAMQLQEHFDVLELADRYRRNALQSLHSLVLPLRRWYGTSHDAAKVSEELRRGADDNAPYWGINHWKSALLRSLSESEAFCEGGFEAIAFIR